MKTQYRSLDELVRMIKPPNGPICWSILNENLTLFKKVQGSSHNHQAWPGGYYDHVQEVMNIAHVLYWQFDALRPLPFSLSDALLVLFLHDIEKPWKYEMVDGEPKIKPELEPKSNQAMFRYQKFREYGISLTPGQENALDYVEGEGARYSPKRRAMNQLAAFCHMADVASARIWFDYPYAYDSWEGAARTRS